MNFQNPETEFLNFKDYFQGQIFIFIFKRLFLLND